MTWIRKSYMKKTIRGSKKPSKLSKLEKDVKQLKRVATPEVKVIDTDITDATMSTSLEANPISLVATGDDDSSRDGDTILVKNIYIRGVLHSANTADGNLVRCILVQDYEQDGNASVFTTTDFLQADNLESFYQSDTNHRRFKVLYDKVHYVAPYILDTVNGVGAASTPSKKMVQIKVRLNKKIYFNGTAATQASAGRGKIYWCTLMDDISGGGSVSFNGNARVTFQDS